jgi:hypothetical protein
MTRNAETVVGAIDDDQRAAARVAGLLFLFLMAAALFAEIYVPSRVIVEGDAAATARNIVASELLVRLSVACDILIFAGDIVLAVAFFVLLRRVSPGLVMLAMLLRVAEATILGMNKLNLLTVPFILSGPDELRELPAGQLQALASTYIGIHSAGFNIGFIYLGLGSAVVSYVLFKSNYVPRVLAGWGVFANLVLTTFTLAVIIFPGAEDTPVIATGRFLPVFFFEVIAGVWLVVKGVRAPVVTTSTESSAVRG